MANYESFLWSFSSSTTPEIVRCVLNSCWFTFFNFYFFFVKKYTFFEIVSCRMLLQSNWDLPLNHPNQLKRDRKRIHFFTAPSNAELNRQEPNMKWELTFANILEKWLNQSDLDLTILAVHFVPKQAKVEGPCTYILGPIQEKGLSNVHFAILVLLRKKVANGTYNPNIALDKILWISQ